MAAPGTDTPAHPLSVCPGRQKWLIELIRRILQKHKHQAKVNRREDYDAIPTSFEHS
jgi:hypothetical protein